MSMCNFFFPTRKEIVILFLIFPIPAAFFIKLHISANNNLAFAGVAQFVAFGGSIIANKNKLLTFVIQFGTHFV
ncbi:hypothetical protein RchiOBHm_Chr2g0121911 [Rosa chinensis]|uniref:Uncharacterized protein n=1 Tax=Rosa chinensis TaxID=74649 RepID=A0A2P6RSP6_ROSCH|nr:hypothetical protein RchiOBHm_Chr2g0121911 [Rosa chinensis]